MILIEIIFFSKLYLLFSIKKLEDLFLVILIADPEIFKRTKKCRSNIMIKKK